MGQGGSIQLSNQTTKKWIRLNEGKYQMKSWHPPAEVPAGQSLSFYYEWDQSIFINPCDDSAYATYQLEGTSLQFVVRAQASGGYTRYYFNTYVEFTTLELKDYHQKTYDMGWNHDGLVYFTAYEYQGFYYLSDPRKTEYFFEHSYEQLKNRRLNQLSMVGSHDAGMYELSGGTLGAAKNNTLTQSLTIHDQLMRGVRFFDLRPVIGNGGKLLAGHYSGMMQIAFWKGRLGGNGGELGTIVADINGFAQSHSKELIVLELSHAYNTDSGYSDMNAEEWERVFSCLNKIQFLLKKSELQKRNLSASNLDRLTLEQLISCGRVIIRLDGECPTQLPDFVFARNTMNIYNEYSDSNDEETMIRDQLSKMDAHKNENNMFALSWTLTQSGCDVLLKNICNDATHVNSLLTPRLAGRITAEKYPNIIYVDNITDETPAVVAYAVNNRLSFNSVGESKMPQVSPNPLVGKYILSFMLFTAKNIEEARIKCPTGFQLLEQEVCKRALHEIVFICFQKTDDESKACKSLDGSNNPNGQKKLMPITDVGIVQDGKCPTGWEKFADVRSFLPKHEHDCFIIVKRN